MFFKFNIPEKVVTDNGTQFKSAWFATFLSKYRIAHLTTPVYHPQANQVEATNKSVKQLWRAELVGQANHVDWAQYVNKAVMHLNTTPRMPTGHYLVYGREKTMTGYEHRLLIDVNSPVDLSKDRRDLIYEEAATKQWEAFEINKRKHNLRSVSRKFNSGDSDYSHKQTKIKRRRQNCTETGAIKEKSSHN